MNSSGDEVGFVGVGQCAQTSSCWLLHTSDSHISESVVNFSPATFISATRWRCWPFSGPWNECAQLSSLHGLHTWEPQIQGGSCIRLIYQLQGTAFSCLRDSLIMPKQIKAASLPGWDHFASRKFSDSSPSLAAARGDLN